MDDGRLAGSPATWAAVTGGLAALFLVANIPLTVVSGQLGAGIVAVFIGIPCAAVGFIVARRQPANPLGWLFLATAICLFVSNGGADYAYLVYRLGHRLPFGSVGLVLDQLWTAGLVLFVVLILLFPDGRLASRFWRLALRTYCAVYIALIAAFAVATAGALAAHPVRIDAAGGSVGHRPPGGLVRGRPALGPVPPARDVRGLHRPPATDLATLLR